MATDASRKSSNPLIGYMTLYGDPSESYFIEALLIVDIKGYPINYYFTDKIPVTSIQRVLYGKTLKHYLTEVGGSKLIDNINEVLSVILVKEKSLVELRKNIKIPILCVNEQNSGKEGKIEFIAYDDYQEDIAKTHQILDICNSNFDVTEPFERIRKLLANPP